jgi:hypothetical protein
MKTKLLFLLAIVFATTTINAQVTDYVTGLSSPSRLIIDGNIIYTKEIDKISQIDVTSSTPTTLFNNIPATAELASIIKNGNTFYISFYDNNTSSNSIAKFNLSTPTTRTDIIAGLGWTPAIALHGNDLYFTEEISPSNMSLKKIDISQSMPTATTILSGLNNVQDMMFNGDVLYIGDRDNNTIYSVDVTASTPSLSSFITSINVRGVYVYNDLLLFNDSSSIKKVPFNNPSNITTIATSGVEFLRDAVVYGNTVYMPQETAGKVVTIVDPTLGTLNDVVNPTNGGTTGFALVGNDLYYAGSNNKISKIDITATSPFSPTDVVPGLNEPEGIIVSGNFMYIAQAGANKISKIDITNPTPTIIDVATGLNEPVYLALNGNDLYISEIGGGKVSKLDITATTPTTTTDVVTGLTTPVDLELNGNDLYIVQADGANKISKINITATLPTTATDVVTGLSKPLHLELNGTDLYFSQTNGNKISKIDISAPTPTVIDVLTGIDRAESLASDNNYLYFKAQSSTGVSYIAKVSLAVLSVNDSFLIDKINIYPNPTKNKLNITVNDSLIINSVEIYNIMGQLMKTVKNSNELNISSLDAGVYFAKVITNKGNITKKIIKE